MTDLEYYRIRRIIPKLRTLAKDYPMHTIENVIQQLNDRIKERQNKINQK